MYTTVYAYLCVNMIHSYTTVKIYAMFQLFWRGVSEVLFWLQSESQKEIQWELQVLITSGKK